MPNIYDDTYKIKYLHNEEMLFDSKLIYLQNKAILFYSRLIYLLFVHISYNNKIFQIYVIIHGK